MIKVIGYMNNQDPMVQYDGLLLVLGIFLIKKKPLLLNLKYNKSLIWF
jgi:hypothetical protein